MSSVVFWKIFRFLILNHKALCLAKTETPYIATVLHASLPSVFNQIIFSKKIDRSQNSGLFNTFGPTFTYFSFFS